MNIAEHAFESAKIFTWLKNLEENPLQYYQVELSDNSCGTYAPLMLSDSYVAERELDASIEMFELAEQKLILNMLIDGVIHQGETAAGCNWRLKLLGWYKSLSQEEKLALPVFGNKLSLTKAVVPVAGLESIKHGYSRYESVRLAYDDINADLQSLGVVSTDYMTVKERMDSKEEFVPQENILVDFKRLQMLDFSTLDDLEKPSEDRPFNDLKHAFATASLGTASDSGANNYLDGFRWLTRLLTGRGFIGTKPLTEVLDPFILPTFRSYLEQQIVVGDLSPSAANTLVSSVRKTLTTIKNIKGYTGSDFINCQGFDADRVTDEANLIDVANLDGPQVVFKTPLASCRNIFNPPDFIKKLSSYVPGSPCALYNMCLGCENVLLTASNLPELFAMERDYLTLKESSRIMDTPYGRVVRENLALLEGILHSKSDFTSEELDEGRRLSEFVDTTVLVDGVAM
jgi:hypothetical protein